MKSPHRWGSFRPIVFGLAIPFVLTTAMQISNAAIAQSKSRESAGSSLGVKTTTAYDSEKNVANIVATNISGRDVTAYDLSIDVAYEGGLKDHHELMIDRLNLLINAIQRGETNPVAFPAGTTHEEPFVPNTVPGHTVSSVTVKVDLVVYADRTVEGNNSDALQRLVNSRTADGSAMGEALAVVKKSLASGKENPSAAAREELQLFHSAPISKDGGMQISRENRLKAVMDDLDRISRQAADHKLSMPESDYLKDYVATRTQRMSIMLAHADLKGGTQ
jgi:hypothetical protein